MLRTSLSGAALVALMSAVASEAWAQQAGGDGEAASDLDVIMVTAQRRQERSQDVPISITAMDRQALDSAAIQDLADVVKLTPALRYDYQGGFAQPTIRGIGSAVTTSGSGSNVGVYIDGFYSPNPLQADFQLLNVDSVQVLKGPQATLFGRNTTGGAILVNTSDPDTDTGGEAQISFEGFNTQRYQAYTTFGLSDTFALDFGGIAEVSDGYLDNTATGDDEIQKSEKWSVRLGAMWDPTDTVSFLLRYSHSDLDDPSSVATNAYIADDGVVAPNGTVLSAAAAFGFPVATDPREVSYTSANTFSTTTDVFQLRGNIDLGFAELTSYTQYRDETAKTEEDFDASALALFDLQFFNSDEIFSQEIILASTPDDSRLEWTAGLFYFQNENRFYPVNASFQGAPFARFGGSGTTTTSAAVFADATYELFDRFFVTGGLRYSYDEVDDAFYDPGPLRVAIGASTEVGPVDVGAIDDDRITPRVVARYEPNDNSSVYASYSQGYKAAIFNVGGFVDDVIDAEELDAYEIGYKYAGDRLSFDAAAFIYDYKDLQLSSFDSQLSIVKNASDSEIKGLEAQGRFRVTDAFEVSAAAAWTDAEYKEYVDSPLSVQCLDPVVCGAAFGLFPAGTTIDASGFEMLRAPEFTGNIGANYETMLLEGTFALSSNVYFTSDFFFDSSNQFRQEGYELVSLRAEWTDPSDRYTLAVYGDNVTDAEYRTQVLPGQFAILQTWGRPASWGVSARARF